MSVIHTTPLEKEALHAIYYSVFQEGADPIGCPIWSEAESKAAGGVYASLITKNLIAVNGKGRNATVWILEEARETIEALLATDFGRKLAAATPTVAETMEPTPEAVAEIMSYGTPTPAMPPPPRRPRYRRPARCPPPPKPSKPLSATRA